MLRAAKRRVCRARNARTLIANFSRNRRPVGSRTITDLTSRITTLCRIRRTQECSACACKRVAYVIARTVARRTSRMQRAAQRRVLRTSHGRTSNTDFRWNRRPVGGRTTVRLTRRLATLCRIHRTRERSASARKRVAYVDASAISCRTSRMLRAAQRCVLRAGSGCTSNTNFRRYGRPVGSWAIVCGTRI
jgi:hypothetical protein